MKKIFNTVIYLLFLYIVFEGIMRIVYNIPELAVKLSDNEEGTWKRNWIKSHQDGKMEFKLDVFDPTKGWVSKPLAETEVLNGDSLLTYSINNNGLRGERLFPYTRDTDKLRILMIGDSFTFGEGVENDETFAYYLQELLPESEIINLGVHGYGHDQILIFLQEEGLKYQPDIVLLGYITADMERNLMNFRDYAKPKFKLRKDQLVLTNSPVPKPEDLIKYNWMHQRSAYLFSYLKFKMSLNSGKYQQEKEAITRAILEEMITVCTSAVAKPIMVYIPFGEQMHKDADVLPEEGFLFEICENNSAAMCFSARPKFKYFQSKGIAYTSTGHHHWKGNYTIAESIKDFLVEKNLYPDSIVQDLNKFKLE